MGTYRLSCPAPIDPFWLRRMQSGQHSATVAAAGAVTVEGVTLQLRDTSLAMGTAVRVWLDASDLFVCATVADIEQEAEDRRAKAAADDAKRRARLDAIRDAALAANAEIALPVRWDVGVKDVLSGLSANSWGDGRSKATVEHIYLLEAFEAGRIKRRKGDFLCTMASGSNGKRWATTLERWRDGDGAPYQPRVSCKACLRIAARWRRNVENHQPHGCQGASMNTSPFLQYRDLVMGHYSTAKWLRSLVMSLYNGSGYKVGLSHLGAIDEAHFEAAMAMLRQYRKHGENDREFMALAECIRARMDEERAAEEREVALADMQRIYVTGVGWCWMMDGEIIEVIE